MIANWQTIDTTTMMFPSEFLIDYVRVYQRKDELNVGCDPKDFPTADYISSHIQAYMGKLPLLLMLHDADDIFILPRTKHDLMAVSEAEEPIIRWFLLAFFGGLIVMTRFSLFLRTNKKAWVGVFLRGFFLSRLN